MRTEREGIPYFSLFVAAVVLLLTPETSFAQGVIFHPLYGTACNFLLGFIEGPFGALITVGAGIGAIIASAVGGFKMAWTLVVVAVGAFILRAWVTLFFAPCATNFIPGGNIIITP